MPLPGPLLRPWASGLGGLAAQRLAPRTNAVAAAAAAALAGNPVLRSVQPPGDAGDKRPPAGHPPGHNHDPVDDKGIGSGAGDPDPEPAKDYSKDQRWVGRRVHPWDASFLVLPWGLVPQDIVKSEVVPAARERQRISTKDRFLNPELILSTFGTSKADVELGAEGAYRFIAKTFSEGKPCFETEYREQVKKQLASCFDLQLRLIPADECLVEIHDVHSVEVCCTFPLLTSDPTNPENLDKSKWLFRVLGMNSFSAQLHFARELFTRIYRHLAYGEKQGLVLAVEVIIKTSETPHFGPNKGVRQDDAEHVLWFYSSEETGDILNPETGLSFELANMNEALSMIHDTATPHLWAAPDSA